MAYTQAYLQTLRTLSDRLIEIQKPIRVLDSIKWPYEWREGIIKSQARELPKADADYYRSIPLGFSLPAKHQELIELSNVIEKQLGNSDPLAKILLSTTDQYLQVLELIKHRGEAAFGKFSKGLYGSAHDHISGDRRNLRDIGETLGSIFSQPSATHLAFQHNKTLSAEESVIYLGEKLSTYFPRDAMRVVVSDGIVSDAAAGGDAIKLNANARFSTRELRVLEVHEGWVHVGTTLTGGNQPWASWLSIGSPRIASHQEGLAVLIETLTFSSFPARARRISDRVNAIYLAEEGADFREVYCSLLEQGQSESEAYSITQRIFRGAPLSGGAPFTKDLSYVRGLVEIVNFIRSAIQMGLPQLLPMLFIGKVHIDDIVPLYQAYLDGAIVPPKYLPDMFRDLNGLYVWFGFSSGVAMVDLQRVKDHFMETFKTLEHISPIDMSPSL
jgi:uncharacterized protein (TIGR02421 family)